MLDDVKDLGVDRPLLLSQNVEHRADSPHVALLQVLDSLAEGWVDLCNLGLTQVEPSKAVALPWSRFVDHGQASVHLQIQIVSLVELCDEVLDETLVESNVANSFVFRLAASLFPHHGRLEEHHALGTDLESQVFDHHIGEVGAETELHALGDGADMDVVCNQVFLDRVINRSVFGHFLSTHLLFDLLVKSLT